MRALRMSGAIVAALVALSGSLAAQASVSGRAAPAAAGHGAALAAAGRAAALAAGSATGGGNGCYTELVPPHSYIVVCNYGGGVPGGPGGYNQKVQCTLQVLTPGQIGFLGLPPPPKGDKWAAITCPGTQPFGGVTLVSANGTPAVTPQELLQVALGELHVPWLKPGTAPPLGDKGLVGLPEWFWIPAAQWQPLSVTVSAGPVWATLVAAPARLTFEPGGGLGGVSCAGPGTPYSAKAAAAGAHPCTFTYKQSSALQPGAAYAASVIVTWTVTWTGSGGAGGTITSALQVPYPFALRVAEGQALVTGR